MNSLLRVGVATITFLVGATATFSLLKMNDRDTTVVHGNVKAASRQVVKPLVATPAHPVKLKIPKLNIDTSIESLGLTAEGDLAAPKGPDTVGWYEVGPRPGSIGSAVIDGHFGWANGKPAVFDNLHTLVRGDLLYIEDEKNDTYTFVVSELREFGPDDDASTVFTSSDNKAHLNLITCQGVWNKAKASYSTRLVVFADSLSD